MTDHLSFDQLCDLADGELSSAAESAADVHVHSCDDCTMRLSAISALAANTAALPRDIAPPEDLWAEIHRELKPRQSPAVRHTQTWQIPQLAAAAAVIAIASSALTTLTLRGHDRTMALPSRAAENTTYAAAQLPAQLASAEHGFTRSVDALQRTLDEKRDSLAPSTVATVERSLRVADSAIAEARDALAHDPANGALAALFASNYERKIDLLRRATELAPRT